VRAESAVDAWANLCIIAGNRSKCCMTGSDAMRQHGNSNTAKSPGRLLSEKEAASHLCLVSVRTLQDWRVRGAGPAYTKLGRRVAYAVADLDAFEAAGRIEPKAAAA
jgi:hypothetical protein